jgi:cytidine kinase
MIDFVTFGIIIDDLVLPDGRTQMGILGGGGSQTAWGMAAALGSGEQVGLVAGMGHDLTEDILASLKAAGINLEGLRRSKLPTPRAWQVTEADGRRTQVWRSDPSTLGKQLAKDWDILPPSYREAKHFHWGVHLEDGTSFFGYDLVKRGKQVSLEAFRVPTRILTAPERRGVFESCTIFSAALDEFNVMMGSPRDAQEAVMQFRALGGRYLVLHEGEKGATAYDCQHNMSYQVPAIQTTVVEEIGAGNTFCGAFTARIDDGCAEALCHAVVAASYMIEQLGLPAGLPQGSDYENRLSTARQNLISSPLTY